MTLYNYKNDLARLWQVGQLELAYGGEHIVCYLHMASQRHADWQSRTRLAWLAEYGVEYARRSYAPRG